MRTVLLLHNATPLGSVPDGGVTEEQALSVVKLLVDKGADLLARDYLGFTPILRSAIRLNLIILDHLLEGDGVPRIDAIDVGDSKYASLFSKVFEYWRRALQLRQLKTEEGGALTKSPLKFEHVKTAEWVTVDELEDVIQHPSNYLVHSFLLKLRIAVSRKTWIAVHRFISQLSGKYLQLYQPDRFAHNLDMLWATMETIQHDP